MARSRKFNIDHATSNKMRLGERQELLGDLDDSFLHIIKTCRHMSQSKNARFKTIVRKVEICVTDG